MTSPSDLRPITFVNEYDKDQDAQAGANIRFAGTLGLPELKILKANTHKCIIVGGGPSLLGGLDTLRRLASDPDTAVFALNYTHNWLLDHGIVPSGCLMFEIDADPTQVLECPNPETTYYICSICHQLTFVSLRHFRRVVWHAWTEQKHQVEALQDCFPNGMVVGGGGTTFTRTLNIGLMLGYRDFELFGCDGSFPDDAVSTHVPGYPNINDLSTDAFPVTAIDEATNQTRTFQTIGYLAQQVDHFQQHCREYHKLARVYVHGDSLMRFVHQQEYPQIYRGDSDELPGTVGERLSVAQPDR